MICVISTAIVSLEMPSSRAGILHPSPATQEFRRLVWMSQPRVTRMTKTNVNGGCALSVIFLTPELQDVP